MGGDEPYVHPSTCNLAGKHGQEYIRESCRYLEVMKQNEETKVYVYFTSHI